MYFSKFPFSSCNDAQLTGSGAETNRLKPPRLFNTIYKVGWHYRKSSLQDSNSVLTKPVPNWPHLSFVNNACFCKKKRIMGDILVRPYRETTKAQFLRWFCDRPFTNWAKRPQHGHTGAKTSVSGPKSKCWLKGGNVLELSCKIKTKAHFLSISYVREATKKR